MNRKIDMKSISGSVLPIWLIVLVCIILILALCVPGFTTKISNPEKGPPGGIGIEPRRDLGFAEPLPDDIELQGAITKINVNVRENKYDCQAVLSIMRDGTGYEVAVLLITVNPEVQSLFEVSLMEDKSIRVWGKEIMQNLEFDGKSYTAYRVNGAMI